MRSPEILKMITKSSLQYLIHKNDKKKDFDKNGEKSIELKKND
jgi:hypothetical protein